MTRKEYRPSPEVRRWLDYAMAAVQSVDYPVPLRWVFYRLAQGLGLEKDAYQPFKRYVATARKRFYDGWTPDTLADDTRQVVERSHGHASPRAWRDALMNAKCRLDVQAAQNNILLVLFEAAAMEPQFNHYLAPLRVDAAPFRGDASIPFKSALAERLTNLHRLFPKKPIVVLYFGDLDPKGQAIPVSALQDIWNWMKAPDLGTVMSGDGDGSFRSHKDQFRWIRVGLNSSQVDGLDLPENPEKPGTYQWEALSDEQASSMILEAVRRYWDPKVVEKIEVRERRAEGRWRRSVRKRGTTR